MKSASLRKGFFAHGKVTDCPIYDLHGHMGPMYGLHINIPDPASMIRKMNQAGVRMLIFCHHTALLAPDIGNRVNIEAVRRFPQKLRAYCGINPNYPEITQKDVDSFEQYSDVYVGFKFLADYHQVPITDPRYKPAWESAEQKSLLILLHTWGESKYDGPELVRKAAERYHKVKIILGHSCYGEWDKAISLIKDFPNTFLELTAVMTVRGVLEKFVKEIGSERILFGTDFPWFDYHYYIGAVLGTGISDSDCRNILYRNAERLLIKET